MAVRGMVVVERQADLLEIVPALRAAGGFPGAPPAAPRAPLSRPLCAYPAYAEYKGEGDKNDAASFRCVAPAGT